MTIEALFLSYNSRDYTSKTSGKTSKVHNLVVLLDGAPITFGFGNFAPDFTCLNMKPTTPVELEVRIVSDDYNKGKPKIVVDSCEPLS